MSNASGIGRTWKILLTSRIRDERRRSHHRRRLAETLVQRCIHTWSRVIPLPKLPDGDLWCPPVEWQTFFIQSMGPVRIRHSSHDFGWQSSHSVDLAGWQAKMASIEIWIPWRNAHKPHWSECTWFSVGLDQIDLPRTRKKRGFLLKYDVLKNSPLRG